MSEYLASINSEAAAESGADQSKQRIIGRKINSPVAPANRCADESRRLEEGMQMARLKALAVARSAAASRLRAAQRAPSALKTLSQKAADEKREAKSNYPNIWPVIRVPRRSKSIVVTMVGTCFALGAALGRRAALMEFTMPAKFALAQPAVKTCSWAICQREVD